MQKEMEVMKHQLNVMEAQIALIPEIKQFIETQKRNMDKKDDQTRLHTKINRLESKVFEAERINRETREKLVAAIETNGLLKEALTTWQDKATNAAREIDRLTEATYLQGQEIKTLKNKAETRNQIEEDKSQKQIPKQSSSSPKAAGSREKKKYPNNTSDLDPPKSTPTKETPETEKVNTRGGTQMKSQLSEKDPRTNPLTTEDRFPKVIYVRSPHLLSMMEERETFTYSLRQHTCAEVTYQMRQIEFILGPDSPMLEKIAKMTGKEAKQHVQDHVPYSPAWQRRKGNELRAIVKRLAEQDMLFREALLATGEAEIRHSVPDVFWGMGTKTRPGLNTYGRILMELRDHLRRTGARSESKQQSENEMFNTVIGRDTECIVISDSQGKWIDRERIFGRRKTIKIKCSKAEDLLSFSKDMLNGPPQKPSHHYPHKQPNQQPEER